jgi:hypothetical protein
MILVYSLFAITGCAAYLRSKELVEGDGRAPSIPAPVQVALLLVPLLLLLSWKRDAPFFAALTGLVILTGIEAVLDGGRSNTYTIVKILLVSIVLRFSIFVVATPVIGVDSWREAANTIMIQAAGHYDPASFIDGRYSQYFPVIQIVSAALSGLTSLDPIVCQQLFVGFLSSVSPIVVVIALRRLSFPAGASALAGLLYAIQPATVFYGINAIPTPLGLFASAMIVYVTSLFANKPMRTYKFLFIGFAALLTTLSFGPTVMTILLVFLLTFTRRVFGQMLLLFAMLSVAYWDLVGSLLQAIILALQGQTDPILRLMSGGTELIYVNPYESPDLVVRLFTGSAPQAFFVVMAFVGFLAVISRRRTSVRGGYRRMVAPAFLSAVVLALAVNLLRPTGILSDPLRYVGGVAYIVLSMSAGFGCYYLFKANLRSKMVILLLAILLLGVSGSSLDMNIAPDANPSGTRNWLLPNETSFLELLPTNRSALVLADCPYYARYAYYMTAVRSQTGSLTVYRDCLSSRATELQSYAKNRMIIYLRREYADSTPLLNSYNVGLQFWWHMHEPIASRVGDTGYAQMYVLFTVPNASSQQSPEQLS